MSLSLIYLYSSSSFRKRGSCVCLSIMRSSVLEAVSNHLSSSNGESVPCAGKATVVPEDLKKFLDTFRGLTKVGRNKISFFRLPTFHWCSIVVWRVLLSHASLSSAETAFQAARKSLFFFF